jgi:hypothetical protein
MDFFDILRGGTVLGRKRKQETTLEPVEASKSSKVKNTPFAGKSKVKGMIFLHSRLEV